MARPAVVPTNVEETEVNHEAPWFVRLRAPFPPEKVGLLPRSTKRENPKGKCNVCNGWHGIPAVHLEYVSHADVTDRLLEVDPEWNWEPCGLDPMGQPYFITNGHGQPIGLWIKLTVCGVTRLGYGSVEAGANEPEKQLIGDALRNAAMRFGVGLDFWRKEDGRPVSESDHTPGFSGAPTTTAAQAVANAGFNVAPAPAAPREGGDVPDGADASLGNCPNCGGYFFAKVSKAGKPYFQCRGKLADGTWCNTFPPRKTDAETLVDKELGEHYQKIGSSPDPSSFAPSNTYWKETITTLQQLPEERRNQVLAEFEVPAGSTGNYYRNLEQGIGKALYDTAKQFLDNWHAEGDVNVDEIPY